MCSRPTTEPIPLDRDVGAAIIDAAVAWFAKHGRDLPWRRTRDPWAILVSEVMLQQLRVARTMPFYERFIARFPTPASLADATLGEALRVWGDLGRYRAAAALHRTAGILVAGHDGRVPSAVDELLALPGIGPYSAGAIACFAHEQPVAFLDTNAKRVLHRVFVGVDVPRPTVRPSELRDLADRLVPSKGAWAWNQSLIEVGALCCKARSVDCGVCPLSRWCVARPEIAAELAMLPRREAATRYVGTNRQHRGQVLRVLREADDVVVSVGDVGRRLRPGYDASDRPWIDAVVTSLVADGLVRRERPSGRRVAEDQAVYLVHDATERMADEVIGLP